MKNRSLWLSWYGLYILCVLLAFIPEATGLWKFLQVASAVAFFVPGGLLIKGANDRSQEKTLRQIRLISILALVIATVMIMLNFFSVLLSQLWGQILYVALILLTGPVSCVPWAAGLFGWACLMVTCFYLLRKK